MDIAGRPYALHAGDHIQIRHTIRHPDHGQLRNGTAATVTGVDADRHELELRLTDSTRLELDKDQVQQADLRLAYVQHPFPAQGHTTHTAHVIVGGQVTREGTYVAITRAREQTHIYNTPSDSSPDADRLGLLAERVSQTEPEMPSISTPLAHEAEVSASTELEAAAPQIDPTSRERLEQETPGPERTARPALQDRPVTDHIEASVQAPDGQRQSLVEARSEPPDATADPNLDELDRSQERAPSAVRVWPTRSVEAKELTREPDPLEHDQSPGWEM